jgi:hypothetical protein
MIECVNDIFELPKIKERYLAKKKIYEMGNLNSREKKLISKKVERIYFVSTFNKAFGVPEYKTEEKKYTEINFIWVEMRVKNFNKSIAKILQTVIPKPLVLIFDYQDEIQINTALKRVNLNDKSKIIIEDLNFSHPIEIFSKDKEEKEFLNSIKINNLSYVDLHEMYKELNQKIFLSQLIDIIEFYSNNIENISEIRNKVYLIKEKEKVVKKLKRKQKRKKDFSDEMKIHIKIVEIEKEIKNIKNKLRGVC